MFKVFHMRSTGGSSFGSWSRSQGRTQGIFSLPLLPLMVKADGPCCSWLSVFLFNLCHCIPKKKLKTFVFAWVLHQNCLCGVYWLCYDRSRLLWYFHLDQQHQRINKPTTTRPVSEERNKSEKNWPVHQFLSVFQYNLQAPSNPTTAFFHVIFSLHATSMLKTPRHRPCAVCNNAVGRPRSSLPSVAASHAAAQAWSPGINKWEVFSWDTRPILLVWRWSQWEQCI